MYGNIHFAGFKRKSNRVASNFGIEFSSPSLPHRKKTGSLSGPAAPFPLANNPPRLQTITRCNAYSAKAKASPSPSLTAFRMRWNGDEREGGGRGDDIRSSEDEVTRG